MFGCNSVNPVYGSRIDCAQIKERMCFSRVRWACLAHIGSMLVNSVHPGWVGAGGSRSRPTFPRASPPSLSIRAGERERESGCLALHRVHWPPHTCQGIERPLLRAAADCCRLERLSAAVPPAFAGIYTGGYIFKDAGQAEDLLSSYFCSICYIFNDGWFKASNSFFSFSQAAAVSVDISLYHWYPQKDAASDKIKEKLNGTSPCDIKFHMSFDNLPHICRDDCYRCGKRNSRPSSLKKHTGQETHNPPIIRHHYITSQ